MVEKLLYTVIISSISWAIIFYFIFWYLKQVPSPIEMVKDIIDLFHAVGKLTVWYVRRVYYKVKRKMDIPTDHGLIKEYDKYYKVKCYVCNTENIVWELVGRSTYLEEQDGCYCHCCNTFNPIWYEYKNEKLGELLESESKIIFIEDLLSSTKVEF